MLFLENGGKILGPIFEISWEMNPYQLGDMFYQCMLNMDQYGLIHMI